MKLREYVLEWMPEQDRSVSDLIASTQSVLKKVEERENEEPPPPPSPPRNGRSTPSRSVSNGNQVDPANATEGEKAIRLSYITKARTLRLPRETCRDAGEKLFPEETDNREVLIKNFVKQCMGERLQ